MQPQSQPNAPAMRRGQSHPDAALIDVGGVATLLGCSRRHIFRLSDAGKMPKSIRLGRLLRWNRNAIAAWIAEGCPSQRGRGAAK